MARAAQRSPGRARLVAARYDRRITLLTRSVAPDADGDPVESWAPTIGLHAEVKERGEDRTQAMQIDVEYDLQIEIRWRGDVSTEGRIVYRGREYEIDRLEEIGRREGLMIYAKEARDGDRQRGD